MTVLLERGTGSAPAHRAEPAPLRRHLRRPAPSVVRRRPAAAVVASVLSWVSALAGLLCLLTTALALLVGGRVLVVQTGSMVPAMPVGTILVARPVPAADVHPGDVVGVPHPDGKLVTHRLVSSTPAGGGSYQLVLKGDANRAADAPVVTRTVMEPMVMIPFSATANVLHVARYPWFQYWLGVMTVAGAWFLARRRTDG